MAIRAAATHQITPVSGAAVCPHHAPPRAAAVLAATSRPGAGLPLVPCLARPAADLLVTEPDAAQATAPSCPPAAPDRALRLACCGVLPAPGAPAGAGPRTSKLGAGSGWAGRGIASTGVVGRSIVPARVRAVCGTRGHGVPR